MYSDHHNQTDAYNTLWPLLIPPVMTLLDDFEAPYKIRGVHVVQKMLERVPVDLLKRTGVDSLLFQVGIYILHFVLY